MQHKHTPQHILFGHAHAMVLISRLERQALWGDTDDEVVHQYCNLAYASKEGKGQYYACDIKYNKWCSTN